MKVLGVTGGIGSGKSAAAAVLGELGALVIDADRVGHETYLPATLGWEQVVREFGREVVAADGTIDRRRLGAIVFADPARRARLDAIVHPLIRTAIAARIAAARRGAHPAIVVEAALLVEARWDRLVDEVWLITAQKDAVERRLMAQRGMDREAIAQRMRAQMDDARRAAHADVIVDNSGSLAELRTRLAALWCERVQDA